MRVRGSGSRKRLRPAIFEVARRSEAQDVRSSARSQPTYDRSLDSELVLPHGARSCSKKLRAATKEEKWAICLITYANKAKKDGQGVQINLARNTRKTSFDHQRQLSRSRRVARGALERVIFHRRITCHRRARFGRGLIRGSDGSDCDRNLVVLGQLNVRATGCRLRTG
jgi:hypothetical protein